ncbi:MAG: CDP-alcohol phosphatidyltransferase family protein [Methanocorpusculum sp.]|nr:CDP-alcohol phosphatidyltransferase family protein [Methanocorpusculum sp.]
MKIMKNIPNILSVSRMFLSVSLLFLLWQPVLFIILYIITGLTDFFDGFLARKYHVETEKGALLDSIADHMYFAVIVISAFVGLNLAGDPVVLSVVIIVAAVRTANFILTRCKFKRWGFIHTLGNKFTALCLIVIVPVCIYIGEMPHWVVIAFGILAAATAVEESLILLRSHSYDINHKSVFCA